MQKKLVKLSKIMLIIFAVSMLATCALDLFAKEGTPVGMKIAEIIIAIITSFVYIVLFGLEIMENYKTNGNRVFGKILIELLVLFAIIVLLDKFILRQNESIQFYLAVCITIEVFGRSIDYWKRV